MFPVIAFFCQCTNTMNEVRTIELNEGWTFLKSGDSIEKPAVVPGCVHTDLLANGDIEDPFYRRNEEDLQWIDKEDWVYKNSFDLPSGMNKNKNISLIFKGLDTYGDVYLNDSLVLSADNMFREWEVPVRNVLKGKENLLKIVFRSPIEEGLEKYNNQGFVIPVSDNDQSERGGVGNKKVSVYTRKAGYHYGWDWGPRFVTSGIWRPVYLKAWDDVRIHDGYIRQAELKNEFAKLSAEVEVESTLEGNYTFALNMNDSLIVSKDFHLKEGINYISLPFVISDPQLWWPNGLGDPYLYRFNFEIVKNNVPLDKCKMVTGLRTVELIRKPDSIGESFYFEINGKPVFMKGANYIPQDNFLTRVDSSRYEHVVQSAADANMNMLRVWGGGIYENDLFYELCDEKGILVWQDFMFACAMFPGDAEFLENVKQEAIQNIKRLRKHPSLALWCGNNECQDAWFNWGWKNNVEKEQGKEIADKIWKAYEDIFHHILPETVATYDSSRAYLPSSPSVAEGIPSAWNKGDYHYWDVWWGQKPFSEYEEKIPRFMSEFGFQSFPELKTVKTYTIPDDRDIYSEVMKAHQRSSIGNQTIENYMLRDYRKPKNFESFLYVGQILQAEGIKTGIEAHRRNMDRCMGSLYWQIDDCWPVASWSGMDYYGRWKALHYSVSKAFREFLVSPVVDNGNLEVHVVSDRQVPVKLLLSLKWMDFNGNLIHEETMDIATDGAASYLVYSKPLMTVLKDKIMNNKLLYCSLQEEGRVIADNILYFVPPKEFKLKNPEIKVALSSKEKGVDITLTSDVPALQVYLTLKDGEGKFSDNYFDLLPGTEKHVFLSETDKEIRAGDLTVLSLIDSY